MTIAATCPAETVPKSTALEKLISAQAAIIITATLEEIGSAEGKRRFKEYLRVERHCALLRGKAAEKARQRHDRARTGRHEEVAFINGKLLKHEGDGVDQHRRRDIADAPVHAAGEDIPASVNAPLSPGPAQPTMAMPNGAPLPSTRAQDIIMPSPMYTAQRAAM